MSSARMSNGNEPWSVAPAAARIAVVGGLERHEAEIQRRAAARACTVEFHRGRVGGRHAEELEAIVARSDLVIIVTQVNSHGAMYLAKKVASRLGRPALLARTCSPSSFTAVLESLRASGSVAPREREATVSV